jgi:DnaJ domain
MSETPPSSRDRFHGRIRHTDGRRCSWPDCAEAGEFKAPKPSGANLPGDGYQWFCLEHVRAFNESYDFHKNLSAEELHDLKMGHPSWDRTTWPFASNGGGFGRASDLHIADPLDILAGQPRLKRFAERLETRNGEVLKPKDKDALKVLGLAADTTPRQIKQRYKSLVRQYHPDSNGGDRKFEALLRKVVEAYTHLNKSSLFTAKPTP